VGTLALVVLLATLGCSSKGGQAPRTTVTELAEAAADASYEGQTAVAAETLERALRLAPTDATLWHRLARVRLTEGRPDLAESLARKSMSLAPDDGALTRANWSLIADSREARGDVPGAEVARAEAKR
jgi:Tfp pilus assembly protein PilF